MVVTRTDWVDWYVDGDDSAVFVGGNVVVLSPLATALVDVVGDAGTSLADLTTALVELFGAPDDGSAESATESAVTDLVGAGVLAVTADA